MNKLTAKQIISFICGILLSALPYVVFAFPFLEGLSGYQVFEFLKLAKQLNQVEPLYVALCVFVVVVLVLAALLLVAMGGCALAKNKVKNIFGIVSDIIFKVYLAILAVFFIIYVAFYIKFTDTTSFVPVAMMALIFAAVMLANIANLSQTNIAKQVLNIVCTMVLILMPVVAFMFPLIDQMRGYQIFELLQLAKLLNQVEPLFVAIADLIVVVLAMAGLLLLCTVGYTVFKNKTQKIFKIMHDAAVQLFIVAVIALFVTYMIYYSMFVDTSEFIPISLLVLVLGSVFVSVLSILSTNLWYYALPFFMIQPIVGLVIVLFLTIKTSKKQSVDIVELKKAGQANNQQNDGENDIAEK